MRPFRVTKGADCAGCAASISRFQGMSHSLTVFYNSPLFFLFSICFLGLRGPFQSPLPVLLLPGHHLALDQLEEGGGHRRLRSTGVRLHGGAPGQPGRRGRPRPDKRRGLRPVRPDGDHRLQPGLRQLPQFHQPVRSGQIPGAVQAVYDPITQSNIKTTGFAGGFDLKRKTALSFRFLSDFSARYPC